MLSDSNRKRTKNKWSDYTLNPRGELWKKDGNNFGNKLLQQMGWKIGEGLGKNRTGITKPIHLVETRNNEGLGYSKMTSDYGSNWLSNQDDFDSLLNQLQQQHSFPAHKPGSTSSVENHGVPLAKRSKKSRKRVHYHRLIQGKDMSNRSQDDWNCVLGNKRKRKELEEEPNPEPESAEHGSSTLLQTSALSSQAYFTAKRLKNDLDRTGNETDKASAAAPEAGMEQNSIEPENPVEDDTEADELIRKKKKKKKKRRKKNKTVGDLDVESALTEEKENECQAEDSLIVLRKGKRKVKKRKNRTSVQAIFSSLNSDSIAGSKMNGLLSKTEMSNGTEGDGCPEMDANDRLEQDACPKQQKKRVRFIFTPTVCTVPRQDSIRGGAGFWMPKAKRKRLGFKIRNFSS